MSELGMLYSPESLRTIDALGEKFRQALKQIALESAKTGGRNLVTDDDVWDALRVLTHAEWLTVKP